MSDRPDNTVPDHTASDSYSADDLAMFAMLRSLTAADSHHDRLSAGSWSEIESALHDQQPQPTSDSHHVRRGVRRRWTVIVTAAALVAAVVTGVVLRTASGDDHRVVIESAQLSSAGLAGAPSGLRGDAEVIQSDRGQVIRVDIGTLRPASGRGR